MEEPLYAALLEIHQEEVGDRDAKLPNDLREMAAEVIAYAQTLLAQVTSIEVAALLYMQWVRFGRA